MDASVMVVLTNEQGWQKRFPLAEGIFVAGSASDARIQLSAGEGIAPYHLQLVNSPREASLRLVNLSPWALLIKSGAQELQVDSGGLRDVFDGEVVYLDTLSMQFEIHKQPAQVEVVKEENRNVIGLRMVLSGQVLYPGGTLTGVLYLRNLGTEACQFDIDLAGLPPECYEISPPALIHAGGEESTEVRFFHRKTAPAPGVHTFDLRVCAPDTYPGRELTVRQSLKVIPCYDYQFGFETAPEPGTSPVDSVQEIREEVAQAPAIPPAAPRTAAPERIPAPPLVMEQPSADPPAIPEEPARVSVPAGRARRPDLTGVKVMKASTGEFLEEKDKQP